MRACLRGVILVQAASADAYLGLLGYQLGPENQRESTERYTERMCAMVAFQSALSAIPVPGKTRDSPVHRGAHARPFPRPLLGPAAALPPSLSLPPPHLQPAALTCLQSHF